MHSSTALKHLNTLDVCTGYIDCLLDRTLINDTLCVHFERRSAEWSGVGGGVEGGGGRHRFPRPLAESVWLPLCGFFSWVSHNEIGLRLCTLFECPCRQETMFYNTSYLLGLLLAHPIGRNLSQDFWMFFQGASDSQISHSYKAAGLVKTRKRIQTQHICILFSTVVFTKASYSDQTPFAVISSV